MGQDHTIIINNIKQYRKHTVTAQLRQWLIRQRREHIRTTRRERNEAKINDFQARSRQKTSENHQSAVSIAREIARRLGRWNRFAFTSLQIRFPISIGNDLNRIDLTHLGRRGRQQWLIHATKNCHASRPITIGDTLNPAVNRQRLLFRNRTDINSPVDGRRLDARTGPSQPSKIVLPSTDRIRRRSFNRYRADSNQAIAEERQISSRATVRGRAHSVLVGHASQSIGLQAADHAHGNSRCVDLVRKSDDHIAKNFIGEIKIPDRATGAITRISSFDSPN